MGDVTVILNGYNRPEFLKTQLDAIKAQTIQPAEIMLWVNKEEGFDKELFEGLTVAISNKNLGVWSRFAYALNAHTEYVCIFDDDTIPGKKWLENCINTMQTQEGLLGTRGVIFRFPNDYSYYDSQGWDVHNEKTEEVDIVGHAWFFKREWLWVLWKEAPPGNGEFYRVGEDMFFSYSLQKHLGIKTYVPPHPVSDLEMSGSLFGWQMGTVRPTSEVAMGEMKTFFRILREHYGWKLLRHG
jgi:GT2 family glycosyltransferase